MSLNILHTFHCSWISLIGSILPVLITRNQAQWKLFIWTYIKSITANVLMILMFQWLIPVLFIVFNRLTYVHDARYKLNRSTSLYQFPATVTICRKNPILHWGNWTLDRIGMRWNEPLTVASSTRIFYGKEISFQITRGKRKSKKCSAYYAARPIHVDFLRANQPYWFKSSAPQLTISIQRFYVVRLLLSCF